MRITRKVQNFCQNNTAFFRDNRHFFELALSEKDASYEKLSSVSRGLLSQKIFQLFSKQVSLCFRTLRLLQGKKIFPTFRPIWVPVSQCDSKGRNSPLHVIREGRLSLFGSRQSPRSPTGPWTTGPWTTNSGPWTTNSGLWTTGPWTTTSGT